MFKKSIMALIIAAITLTSMSTISSAKNFKFGHGWGHHHHHGHHVKVYKRIYFGHSCHYYKKKWQSTHKKHWFKKYKICLFLKY